MEKKYSRKKIWLIVIVNFSVIVLILISLYRDHTFSKNLENEYPSLSHSDKLYDTVKATYYPKGGRFGCCESFVTFKSGKKLGISSYKSINPPNVNFGYNLSSGNFLIKSPSSDTLLIISEDDTSSYLLKFYNPKADTLSFIEKIFRK